MEFSKVHNVSEIQLQILLTARFIMIVIYMHKIFNPWSIRISRKYKREISMIKFIKYLNKNPEKTYENSIHNDQGNKCSYGNRDSYFPDMNFPKY